MRTNTPFEQLLAELASTLGLSSLSPTDDGVCTLVVDQDLPLNLALAPDGRDLVLFSPLGAIAPAHQPVMYARMLRANGAGASPVVLGIATGSDTGLISARRPLERLSGAELAIWTGSFVGIAQEWRAALRALAEQPVATDDQAGPASPMHWLQA